MRHTHRARAAAATVILAVLTAGAAGCNPTGSGPTPSPTPTATATSMPTPTTTPTLSERDQNIADAKATYLDYVAAYDAAAQAGFVDRDLTTALLNLTGGGDARTNIISDQATFEENGLAQTGSTIVKSLLVTEYVEDASEADMHGVKLRACVDLSATDVVYSDGTSTTPTDRPQYRGPRNVYVEMLRQPAGWVVQSELAKPEERC